MQDTDQVRDKATQGTNRSEDSSSTDQSGRWKRRAKEFFDQIEKDTGRKLTFTPVFNEIIDVHIKDRRFPLRTRLLAWGWRTSWGNHSRACAEVDSDGNVTRYHSQRSAAELFGERPQKINEEVASLREFGYFEPDTGNRLIPSLSLPKKIRTGPDFFSQTADSKDTEFSLWWKTQSPEDCDEYYKLEATFLPLLNKKRAARRKFQKFKAAQKPPESPEKPPDPEPAGNPAVQPDAPDMSGQETRTVADEKTGQSRTSSIFFNSPTINSAPPPPQPLVNGVEKAEEEERFQQFKGTYPPKHFDEAKARSLFRSLPPPDQQRALERLRNVYLSCDRWKDDNGRWIPLASNFLKDGYFDAQPPPRMEKIQGSKQIAPLDELAEKLKRMREGT